MGQRDREGGRRQVMGVFQAGKLRGIKRAEEEDWQGIREGIVGGWGSWKGQTVMDFMAKEGGNGVRTRED